MDAVAAQANLGIAVRNPRPWPRPLDAVGGKCSVVATWEITQCRSAADKVFVSVITRTRN